MKFSVSLIIFAAVLLTVSCRSFDFEEEEERNYFDDFSDDTSAQNEEERTAVAGQVGVVAPKCHWAGTAPFCMGKCGGFYRETAVDKRGDGFRCLTGYKRYCCPTTDLVG